MSSIRWPSPRELAAGLQRGGSRRVGAGRANARVRDPPVTELRPGRVYILPTGVGVVFAIMAFAMLLGSMNYNNNLSFVLTFLLVGVGFVAMHQCQRNLVGLELSFAGTEPVFAGQAAQFRIAVTNRSKNPRQRIRLYLDEYYSNITDLQPGESQILVLPVKTTRAWLGQCWSVSACARCSRSSCFAPGPGLHMEPRGLVYPRAADESAGTTAVAHGTRAIASTTPAAKKTSRDCASSMSVTRRATSPGKPMRATASLLSKQFAGADMSSQWFDFDESRCGDLEERLSILTRWIVDADRTREDYGLRIPGQSFPPSHGEAHRRRCLEALALYGKDSGDV